MRAARPRPDAARAGHRLEAALRRISVHDKTTSAQLGVEAGGELPDRAMLAHGVNNAMALKTSARLVARLRRRRRIATPIHRALDVLDRYHGLPNGMFSADEHYAGPRSVPGRRALRGGRGLFSLQHVIPVTGDAALADRVERIAFNALPATFSADMWSHQYDQQPNQVMCTWRRAHGSATGPSRTCSDSSQLRLLHRQHAPGLAEAGAEPVDADARPRLAAVTYAPSEVRTVVAGDIAVTITEDTVPIPGHGRMKVSPAAPVTFPLLLRIPGWARRLGAGERSSGRRHRAPGGFLRSSAAGRPVTRSRSRCR